MINEGVIYLLDSTGETVSAKKYKHPSDRKQIIKNWKRMYSIMFKKCYLQIAPASNPLLVNEKGLNMKKEIGYNIDGKYINNFKLGAKENKDADMTGANMKAHIFINSH